MRRLRGLVPVVSSLAYLALPPWAEAQDQHIVYQVAHGVAGNQDYGGSLGLDFDVELAVRVTRLGVFDDLSDGLKRTITARLYDRDTLDVLATLVFEPDDPGELVGGSRFKDLDEPVPLAPGFHGTMVADGYGPDERNGNTHGGPAVIGWTTSSANCSIIFTGGSRYGTAGLFPGTGDGGPVNRYAAGTFQVEALEQPVPRGGIAYLAPPSTFGNEAFAGVLGMDFDVQGDTVVTRLGVFDDGSDGLNLPLTARLYNRESRTEMASLSFDFADPGELLDGSRFKSLAPPLSLPAGFRGVITAEGYGDAEKDGNSRLGPLGLATDSGNCLLAFVGSGRRGPNPGEFPETRDRAAPNAYAAGTFEFKPSETPIEVPRAPTGLAATVAGGQFRLSWIAPQGGLPVDGYNVYRTSGGVFRKMNPALVTTTDFAFDGGPVKGVATCFQVRSVSSKLESPGSGEACAVLPPDSAPERTFIAYRVPAETAGNDPRVGSIGLDFETRTELVITRLGAFDDGSDGLVEPITVRLFDRAGPVELASLQLTPEDGGELVGGSRFKTLAVPILLPAGFLGTIAAEGYGDAERAGNQSAAPLGLTRENGSCSIAFTGARTGRAGAFPPAAFLSALVDPFAAATFEYGPVRLPPGPPPGGIAYPVAEATPGNQEFGGGLGLDFIVESPIVVTRLGVFDDLSDGLLLPLTASLYDRARRRKLATLEFSFEDPGELVGGSRFKDLDPPLVLMDGFLGAMVGEGYGIGERNGNTHGQPADMGWTLDDGGCLISFVGGGRVAQVRGQYPDAIDGGPVNRYAAGTFRFEPLDAPASVVRDLSPDRFPAGEPVAVSLQVTAREPGANVLVEETFSGMAQASGVSAGGVLTGNKIVWDLAGVTSRTLTYTLTPDSCAGNIDFEGSTFTVGRLVVPVGGERVLAPAPFPEGTLAAPWTSADIGTTGGGAQAIDEHGVVASAQGLGVRQLRDEFRSIFLTGTADYEVSAAITCLNDPGGRATAGLMVRNTIEDNSANIYFALTPVPLIGTTDLGTLKATFRRDTAKTTVAFPANAATPEAALTDAERAVQRLPIYLRIKKTGTTLSLERSDTGVAGSYVSLVTKEIGPATDPTKLALVDAPQVGLAVSSAGSGTSRVTFGEVSGPPFRAPAGKLFRRGDLNFDQKINITDAINFLSGQFLGQAELMRCRDAADGDDDGKLNITDAIFLLSFLFQGGDELPAPGPYTCGLDPSADVGADLGCEAPEACVDGVRPALR